MTDLTESQITFIELFNRFDRVEIPIIQRDYAQGRESAEDVRNGLLQAIYEKLDEPVGAVDTPLDMDFIYGSIETNDQSKKRFCPLDGQQRLTTLFLLYWFAAAKEDAMPTFRELFCDPNGSKFVYCIRESSTEFIDALCDFSPDDSAFDTGSRLSKTIQDQPWFFLYWKQDPTVQSALSMLDAIQTQFTKVGDLLQKLYTEDKPYITFQLLELEQYGLTDDLYIKMNARGKPLTAFENFKARIQGLLKEDFQDWKISSNGSPVTIFKHFSEQIEKSWSDLFWNYREGDTPLFDNRIMNLFRILILITREDSEEETYKNIRESIRDKKNHITYPLCHRLRVVDHKLLKRFVSCLDHWEKGEGGIRTFLDDTSYFDERKAFDQVTDQTTSPSYDDLIIFHAYTSYLEAHNDSPKPERLWEWMRVTSNLARNAIYNRQEDFLRALRGITQMLPNADEILTFLANNAENITGINEQQLREERIKAQLILKHEDWRTQILKAEQHGYFSGQIEFILKFSGILESWLPNMSCDWTDETDSQLRAAFTNYYDLASSIFDSKGLINLPDCLWERALLSQGDYLVESRRKHSFLKSEGRETSWKRLLRGSLKELDEEKRRDLVKQVFDKIDLQKPMQENLTTIIENSVVTEEWRKLLVEKPALIKWCDNRLIRWDSEQRVYLLKTTQMNGRHVDLFTFNYYLENKEELLTSGDLKQFDECEYQTRMDTWNEPSIDFTSTGLGAGYLVSVQNTRDDEAKFNVIVSCPVSKKEQYQEQLEDECFIEFDGDPNLFTSQKSIPRDQIKQTLITVTNII
ncbi:MULTISPECIES: DUF262 domain-containing protein [unclassified Lentimonas]|uniref:DUF262 domain-containing protein n=1 Tax=unclassified Lentimonas TaxID=2630993 RepID=UPI001325332A|nr:MULTISPECIES: DUF262 domain-containing protein [unclassified Lentimonas]CAA6689984.1 Unannotated [Lentimonas sp. CC10]CAA6691060.1 Unannotated [Lentimonas sp. CC19]CAA7069326.1 Unannotated [Lentimonas sp. CC11]